MMARKLLILSIMVSLLSIVCITSTTTSVESSGGFPAGDDTLYMREQRAVFTMNGDGTMTTILDFDYYGTADEFGWLIPVPAVPTIEVLENLTLTNLQSETSIRFTDSVPHVCSQLYPFSSGGGSGGGDGRPTPYTGNLGPYDYQIIEPADSAEVATWLEDNNYQVSADTLAIVDNYIAQDWLFVALNYREDTVLPRIKPVVLTYSADKPVLPLQLTATSTEQTIPFYVWIFADTQYEPENYAHVRNMYDVVRRQSAVFNIGKFQEAGSGFPQQYFDYYARFQTEHDGQLFITEYAQPTSGLVEKITDYEDSFLAHLASDFDYVTMMRAQLSPEQMTLDPSFVPSDTPEPRSNLFDWALVDPLHFYGCSTRTALLDINTEALPPERAYFADWSLDIAYPTGWELSELEIVGESVYVYAPEPITVETINAYFAGEPTPPMFIFTPIYHYLAEGSYNNDHEYGMLTALGQPRSSELPYAYGGEELAYVDTRYKLTDPETVEGILYALLTTPEDWASNEALYTAMMGYPRTYQFLTGPNMRNTVFLKDGFDFWVNSYLRPVLQVPYPEDWQEFTDDERNYVIALNGDTDGPSMRLVPFGRFYRELASPQSLSADDLSPIYELASTWASDFYNIDVPPTIWGDLATCDTQARPEFGFEKDGRLGFVYFSHGYIVEISAPTAEFATYADMLTTLYQTTLTNLDAIQDNGYICN